AGGTGGPHEESPREGRQKKASRSALTRRAADNGTRAYCCRKGRHSAAFPGSCAAHDPEKWTRFSDNDHAQTRRWRAAHDFVSTNPTLNTEASGILVVFYGICRVGTIF